MKNDDIATDCVKYCIIKARTGNCQDALEKISKALHNCDGSKQSIHECIMLLRVLEDEG